MKNIKIFSILLLFSVILTGCSNSKSKNHTIVENIVLNKSTYKDVEKTVNIQPEKYYDEKLGIYKLSGWYDVEYTINNIDGKLKFIFDNNSDKLICVHFDPNDYSKETGDSLKTYMLDRYNDYEQTIKDTGFVFSNGTENVELYMTDDPLDSTQYHGLYVEWNGAE